VTFLSPAFLYGLAAAALPLLLHLVRRRRVRIVPWGAWRFLLHSHQKLRRRLRVEQLLLAILRALLVATVVLAFARPVLRAPAAALRSANAPVHAVIALDNSMSMGFRRDGRADFARAQDIADFIVARLLRHGDTVSLALASSRPQVPVREPSHDLEGARRKIRAATVTDNGTDYRAVARLCAQLAAPSRAARKEVYLITDNQLTGFAQPIEGRADEIWSALAKAAHVTWVDVAEDRRPNASLSAPSFSRGFVTPASPVRIETDVANRTGRRLESAVVRLEVNGRPAGSAVVSAAPNSSARATFAHLFEQAGTQTGRLVLDTPDGLPTDNSGWFALSVRPAMRVLVVGPEGTAARPGDALFVSTALAPTGVSEGGSSDVRVTVRPSVTAAGASLRGFDAIVVSGTGPPTRRETDAIRDYVHAGGGVLVFASAQGGRTLQALATGPEAGGLQIGAGQATSLDRAFTLDTAALSHPALAMFRGSDEADLASAKFTERVQMRLQGARTRAAGGRIRLAARFADGQPAIVEIPAGAGSILLCAFPVNPSVTDLPLKPAFVPLIHQLTAHLASGKLQRRMVGIGGECVLRFPLTSTRESFRITPPAGAGSILPTTGLPDSLALSCPPATQAGIYRVSTPNDPARLVDAYAANASPAESDLAHAGEPVLRRMTGGIQMGYARSAESLRDAVRTTRHGYDMSEGLLVTALALLAIEALAARLAGRRT